MTAQQGFLYEVNASNFLKKFGLVKPSFRPAGAGHDQPDLMVTYKKVDAGVELKITDASAGSLVLKYDVSNKRNPWSFGNIAAEEKEKLFIKDLADNVKLFDRIKKEWKEVPFKREKDEHWETTAGRMTPEQRYRRDLEIFKDIKGEISAAEIENYYNTKKTYYVNIGTHGFYLFGTKDPLKLNTAIKKIGSPQVPTFNSSAKAIYRARVQYKGGGNYQFTFELQFKVTTKSPYNIAPISGSSVSIDKSKANISCFP